MTYGVQTTVPMKYEHPQHTFQTFSEFWKTDVKSRRGKYSRLDEDEALLEEGKEFGLDGTIIQGLFEEAQKDEATKGMKKEEIYKKTKEELGAIMDQEAEDRKYRMQEAKDSNDTDRLWVLISAA